ncbi:MAG TPA: hypothetical protein VE912_02795 [Bacteroidales bacterium]|nr:hypothetical protein [Bacteroidales bacterium]
MLFFFIVGIFLLGIGEFIERKKQIKRIENKLFNLFENKKYSFYLDTCKALANEADLIKLFEKAQINGFYDIRLLILKNINSNKLIFNEYLMDDFKKTLKINFSIEYKNEELKTVKRFAYVQFFHSLNQDNPNAHILVLKHDLTSILETKKARR